jgi:hypothetical protein
VKTHYIAIVPFAFLWIGEDGVGFADLLEFLGVVWGVGVEIGVVGFGEGVELLFEVCGGGGWGDAEDFVVVWFWLGMVLGCC